MTWSLPEPPPAEPVLGDPASVAALGLALRQACAQLGRALEAVDVAAVPSRRHAARVRALRTRAAPLTASMDRVGAGLAEHASELADAVALARGLVERAEAAGLRIDGPAVGLGRGVHGVADAAAEIARDETRRSVQLVLDTILLDLDVARRRLRTNLESEQSVVRRR